MKKKSKRYKKLKETYKKKELNKFEQILNELKNGSGVKFVESIDISMKINLKKIKRDTMKNRIKHGVTFIN